MSTELNDVMTNNNNNKRKKITVELKEKQTVVCACEKNQTELTKPNEK